MVFLRPRSPHDPDIRMFGFHHAGGSSSAYYPLIGALPASWDALFFDLPGRGKRHREPLPQEIDAVAADAVRAMMPWLDRPFILFGHSLGAVVAYEVAARLTSIGLSPAWVGLSGRGPTSSTGSLRVSGVTNAELIDWMIDMGGTPDVLRGTPELAARVARVLRSDLLCLERHVQRPAPPLLRCPITAFGGREDRIVTASDLAGWAARTSSTSSVRLFAGGHFFLLGEALPAVAAAIEADAGDKLHVRPRQTGELR